MIPSVIASQVEQGIKDFLQTMFPPSRPFFKGILDRLFEEHDFSGSITRGNPIPIPTPLKHRLLRETRSN